MSVSCYICGNAVKVPEQGAIHPAGGFGFRHLTCDPQEHVQQLPVDSPGDETDLYQETKTGDVELSPYGALIAARTAADVARQRAAAKKGGDS